MLQNGFRSSGHLSALRLTCGEKVDCVFITHDETAWASRPHTKNTRCSPPEYAPLLVIKWYFFFFLQITFRGHLMLTALDEGVLGGWSVDLGEYLCARVVVAKYEQFQA